MFGLETIALTKKNNAFRARERVVEFKLMSSILGETKRKRNEYVGGTVRVILEKQY